MPWLVFARSVSLWGGALSAGLALAAWPLLGLATALGVLAGGALLILDIHALAWLVASAFAQGWSRRALVWALLPLKFLAVGAAVWAAVVPLQLDPIGLTVGVTAALGAVLAAAVSSGRG